jgi:hypothetical protein
VEWAGNGFDSRRVCSRFLGETAQQRSVVSGDIGEAPPPFEHGVTRCRSAATDGSRAASSAGSPTGAPAAGSKGSGVLSRALHIHLLALSAASGNGIFLY